MENNNNNNNNSNSYKDYKYVYTGYKDYCKNHDIKTNADTKKETKTQEYIDHDHRFAFDFNNPKQHTHDYSFDFPTNQQPEKKQSSTTIAQQKIENKKNYNYSTTTTYKKTATTTNSDATKQLKVFFAIIFVFFIIIITSSLVDLFNEVNEINNTYNNSNNEIIEEEDYYENVIDDYIRAIENLNYEYLKHRITQEEINYDGGLRWQNEIENIKNFINSNYINSFDYQIQYAIQLNGYSLTNVQNKFNNTYNSTNEITDAYQVSLILNINNKVNLKVLTIGKINDTWYLINIV